MAIYLESLKSLHIILSFKATMLSQGTAFLVRRNMRVFVVTNRHNFTGRHQDTNQPLSSHGGVPDAVHVWHRRQTWNPMGSIEWASARYPLIGNDGEPLWREHPHHGQQMDVVSLEITPPDGIIVDEYSLDEPQHDFVFGPTDNVSIVGFPFGIAAAAKIAVWTTGTIATELDVDFEGKPVFLVDARTRPGQSGSPVIVFRSGGTFRTIDGATAMVAGLTSIFMGIYSGRINAESDLGKVWKRSAIRELIDAV
jgi:hypothetical protein